MRPRFLFLFLALYASHCNAQKLNTILSIKAYAGDRSETFTRNVTRTADNGFIVCLKSNSSTGNYDLTCAQSLPRTFTLFQKFEAFGNTVLWERCYYDTTFNIEALYPLDNGQFIVCGNAAGSLPSGHGLAIRKEASDKSILWTKAYGGTGSVLTQAILQTPDKGYLMAGESYVKDGDVGAHYGSLFSADIWLLKVDSNGDRVWARNYGGTNVDRVRSLLPAPQGGYYVVGFTYSNDYDCIGLHDAPGRGADAYIMRLDSNGNKIWHRCLGGTEGDGAYDACSDGNGGLVLACSSLSNDGDVHGSLGKGEYNYWIVNMDSTGAVVWDDCFGAMNARADQSPAAICKGFDGTYWIAGGSSTAGGEVDTAYGKYDCWVLHLDAAGKYVNSRVLGCPAGSGTRTVTPLQDNAVAVAGHYLGPGGTMPSIYSSTIFSHNAFFTRLSAASLAINPAFPRNFDIGVFPNPAAKSFSIRIEGVDYRNGSIYIYDNEGKLVQTRKNIQEEVVYMDCSAFRKGIYLVKFESGKKGTITKSITIN